MRRRRRPGRKPTRGGFTLVELLWTLTLLGLLLAIVRPALAPLGRLSLFRSADIATLHLERARLLAVARRQPMRVRVDAQGALTLEDPEGTVLERTELTGEGLLALDSLRLRPSTLRYNPRGQASPGSLYLYKGARGVRIVSNFVGRVRREVFTVD